MPSAISPCEESARNGQSQEGFAMSSHNKINISKNGPYLVSGSVPLAFQTIGVNKGGESTEWIERDSLPASAQYALCRCGQSKTKPFCDGTHAKIGFDGTETASHE